MATPIIVEGAVSALDIARWENTGLYEYAEGLVPEQHGLHLEEALDMKVFPEEIQDPESEDINLKFVITEFKYYLSCSCCETEEIIKDDLEPFFNKDSFVCMDCKENQNNDKE